MPSPYSMASRLPSPHREERNDMPRVLGIDLGTTNSAMAVITAGDPEIIENANGKRTTPSVVAVDSKTKERFVGEAAKNQAITNPENTVFSV